MKKQCAWCGTVTEEGDGPVSHTLCPRCYGKMMPEEEEKVRTSKLGDLLSTETLDKVVGIMNEIQAGKLDISAGQKKILAVIEPERAALLDKGILADYLAYYLAAAASQPGKDLSFLPVDN